MGSRQRVRFARPIPALLAMFVLSLLGSPVRAGGPPTPLPGERHLAAVQVAQIVDSMDDRERSVVGADILDPSVLPVAYTHGMFRIDRDAAGSETIHRLDAQDISLMGLTASVTDQTGHSGTDFYASLAVWRTNYSGYEWGAELYFDWKAGIDGMNAADCSRDEAGISWGNDHLSAGSRGAWSGKYWSWLTKSENTALNIRKSDQVANKGVGWDFNEWKPTNFHCSSTYALWWGHATLYLRESSYRNLNTDFVAKYYHTYPILTTSYSLSFSSPGISISPTNDKWAAVLAVDLTT